MCLEELEKLTNSYTVKLDRIFFHEILLKGTISRHAMLPNTNLQYCIIALYFLLKLFGLQMGDWPIEGGGGAEFMLGLGCDL